MIKDQKEAMKMLFFYVGGELLAIGGTAVIGLLLNSSDGGVLLNIVGALLLSGLFASVFIIPVWIAEEELGWGRLQAIALMILFGLLFLIIPVTLLKEACRTQESEVKKG